VFHFVHFDFQKLSSFIKTCLFISFHLNLFQLFWSQSVIV
jgi:hypothetical protein